MAAGPDAWPWSAPENRFELPIALGNIAGSRLSFQQRPIVRRDPSSCSRVNSVLNTRVTSAVRLLPSGQALRIQKMWSPPAS
jgi:hypothetical protein